MIIGPADKLRIVDLIVGFDRKPSRQLADAASLRQWSERANLFEARFLALASRCTVSLPPINDPTLQSRLEAWLSWTKTTEYKVLLTDPAALRNFRSLHFNQPPTKARHSNSANVRRGRRSPCNGCTVQWLLQSKLSKPQKRAVLLVTLELDSLPLLQVEKLSLCMRRQVQHDIYRGRSDWPWLNAARLFSISSDFWDFTKETISALNRRLRVVPKETPSGSASRARIRAAIKALRSAVAEREAKELLQDTAMRRIQLQALVQAEQRKLEKSVWQPSNPDWREQA